MTPLPGNIKNQISQSDRQLHTSSLTLYLFKMTARQKSLSDKITFILISLSLSLLFAHCLIFCCTVMINLHIIIHIWNLSVSHIYLFIYLFYFFYIYYVSDMESYLFYILHFVCILISIFLFSLSPSLFIVY